MAMAFSVSGSPTLTVWKRRVSAGSFSKYWRYSAQVVAAIVRSRPRARAGLSRLAASPVPAEPPAPIRVWASSMNRMIGLGEASTSSITWRRRFSNSPFTLAPACSRPMSSARRVTSFSAGGTSPSTMRRGEALRPPRSCRRPPRRSGSGCSGGGAAGYRSPGGSRRRGRRSGRSRPCAPSRSGRPRTCASASPPAPPVRRRPGHRRRTGPGAAPSEAAVVTSLDERGRSSRTRRRACRPGPCATPARSTAARSSASPS